VIVGLLDSNGLSLVFEDGNAYLFLMYLPIWSTVFDRSQLRPLASLMLASAAVLSVKTLLLFHIFGNQYDWANIAYLYIWIRDTRIGEITPVSDVLWRIFIQSQLYVGIALLWVVVHAFVRTMRMCSRKTIFLPALYMAAFAVSLSRSFWLGFIAAIVVLKLFFSKYLFKNWKWALNIWLYFFSALLIAGGLVFISSSTAFSDSSFSNAVFSRLAESGSDAAGISRIHQAGPLMDAAFQHPLRGSGFGELVTYFSSDPTIKTPLNPDGRHTTYAFELGYLEQWLKLGGVAMVAFILVLLYQFYRGWLLISSDPEDRIWVIGLLAGFLYVMVVHSVSPYLNHPLGLGYTMLVIVVLHSFYLNSKNA